MVLHVVGARPNFMKVAPVMAALDKSDGIEQALVHTGQHFDANMSAVFFDQLGIPRPEINLEVGSGSHAAQTAAIMTAIEPVLLRMSPDLVMVYGDVNSTVAAALVCAKLLIPVAHVEAGLRSYDRTMPEEINRVLTDQVSELLFTPSADANENLLREGVLEPKIHFVGNVMIDTLARLLPSAEQTSVSNLPEKFALVTLHRPSNVDDQEALGKWRMALQEVGERLPVWFPVHPRTRQKLAGSAREVANGRLRLMDPVGYVEFLAMQRRATVVITDSGGIQEETTFLGVPCLTGRENTERPITVTLGTNTVVGRDPTRLLHEVDKILAGKGKKGQVPPLWEGKAGERIAAVVTAWHQERIQARIQEN
jgi:UDP-N-acetylglucosamine 2-epimerase (non-hydrolysing)